MIDWSATAAWIALVISVASPLATTVINNRHQREMRDREFYDEHRAKALECYVRAVGAFIRNPDTLKEYGQAYAEVFFYAPPELWPKIEELNSILRYHADFNDATDKFTAICKELAKNPPRLKH